MVQTAVRFRKLSSGEIARYVATGALVTAEEGTLTGGFGAEIAAVLARDAFWWLDAPVERYCVEDVPMPYHPALLEAVLASPDRPRFGIGLRMVDADASSLGWLDVPAQGQASAQVSFVPATRGLHELPAIHIETRFPLGLFVAWSYWRPASRQWVYPAIEAHAPALRRTQPS